MVELTFVNQYGDSAPKRRRLAKACEACRARKKRCIHVSGAATCNDTDQTDAATNHVSSSSHTKDSSPGGAKRFIGDLDPAATFWQRASPVDEGEARRQNGDIGVWVDKNEWDALLRQRNTANEDATAPALTEKQRPHSAVMAPLVDIYFKKVHTILPLLDEAEFRRDHAGGIVPEPLAHALCLVAAKAPEAAPHLRLNESTAPISAREFCSRLHASITAALRVPCKFEKITLIRILALASLHAEGQDGGEEASMCLTQAMHYTQTMGWHLGQSAGPASSDELATKRLFWCLWSLDRVNSCMYGRPIMMSDVDIAIEPFQVGESGFPAFELWLHICRTLNKIVAFYRPGNDVTVTGWEENFPNFEDAVEECQAWDEPPSVLATLHLFFLTIAVLSHRSRGVKYMCRASASYIRQALCSIEIYRLMSSHLFATLHPLPILPYAISLALSVSYQHLRQAQLPHSQQDAREDFKVCVQVLQKLRRTWPSADVIATIGTKVLEELDKVEDLSSFRVSRVHYAVSSSPGYCAASLSRPHTLIDSEAAAVKEHGSNTSTNVANPHRSNVEQDWSGLFEGMDDIFGTYLDPNYPVNLDDFSFVDNHHMDWNGMPGS